jgi:glycosyltransferase involved in cell wall biosynthesis
MQEDTSRPAGLRDELSGSTPAGGSHDRRRSITILGIRGIPAAHGGFETLAERLALFLLDRGWDVTVYCQGSASGKREEDSWRGVRRVLIPVRWSGALGTIEFDVKCVADAHGGDGTILTLGYNTGFLALWLRITGRTNCINMDGLEWRRDKYGLLARIWLWVNERLAIVCASALLADHPRIEDRIKRIAPKKDVTMIPYGGDGIDDARPDPLEALGLRPGEFMTLIARPEPENSIAEIVEAFSAEAVGIKLVVLGHYDAANPFHARVVQAASDDVLFPGAIYDAATLHTLRRYCLGYFHGHKVGGTNPSLVEALAAGNPIIAHDNMFNRWVAGEAALYFSDVAGCRQALRQLMTDPDRRARMNRAALDRWRQDFRWPPVLHAYETLLLRIGSRHVGAPASGDAGTVGQT